MGDPIAEWSGKVMSLKSATRDGIIKGIAFQGA
jgi:hypothetical protein